VVCICSIAQGEELCEINKTEIITACLKNAVGFLVAKIYKINFTWTCVERFDANMNGWPCSSLFSVGRNCCSYEFCCFDCSKYIGISDSVRGRGYASMLVEIGSSLQTGDVLAVRTWTGAMFWCVHDLRCLDSKQFSCNISFIYWIYSGLFFFFFFFFFFFHFFFFFSKNIILHW